MFGPSKSGGLKKVALIGGGVVALTLVISALSGPQNHGQSNTASPESASTAAEKSAAAAVASASTGQAPEEGQLRDAKYLDDKYDAKAVVACGSGADDYLRSIAKYSFDWDEDAKGFFGVKFGRYLSIVPSPGVLVMTSDRAKLQNGFGAWQHVHVFCRYDTQADKVLDFDTDAPPSNE